MDFTFNENQIALFSESGVLLAEVTFPYADEQKKIVEINHTFVDESLRGQGMAGKLMSALAEYLKSKSLRAVPTCSYAVSWFKKHPEFSDLLCNNICE